MGTGCRPAAPIGHIPVKRKKSSKFRRPYGRVWGILPAPWGALSEFTIKRNKWFILYKGVLKGLKGGDFRARPS